MWEGDPKQKRVPNRQEGGFGHWSSERYETPEGIKERPVWNQDTPRSSGPEVGTPVGGKPGTPGEANAQTLNKPMGDYEYDDNGYLVRK